jgi:hypothetical protein
VTKSVGAALALQLRVDDHKGGASGTSVWTHRGSRATPAFNRAAHDR